MSRFFAPIKLDDFKKLIQQHLCDKNILNSRLIQEKLNKDLKVKFDFENFSYNSKDFGPSALVGYHTWENDFTFLGFSAGGDWESSIIGIIYFDGKKLRAYIPKEGNPWNTDTNEAYGNNEKKDLINAKKRWPIFKNATEVEPGDFSPNVDEIIQDIKNRIKPLNNKQTLQERIEALSYYGEADEGTELFEQTCHYCYKLYGLGNTDWAEIVCSWAEKMAESSKEDADSDSTIKGYWG